jgi:hypothetical protein
LREKGGWAETYFEKHRGDETPYAKISADDKIFDDAEQDALPAPTPEITDAADDEHQLAQLAETNDQTISKAAVSTSNACKVYQTDIEIGLLYILPADELLFTFRLQDVLYRIDRCTGRNYAHLHRKQS